MIFLRGIEIKQDRAPLNDRLKMLPNFLAQITPTGTRILLDYGDETAPICPYAHAGHTSASQLAAAEYLGSSSTMPKGGVGAIPYFL